ncbi:hypothetical protein J1614_009627 [Plenodomus biglobosus]|nr:hypothetical protein J1614_009627 [Plenodomus biglobosus]
MRTSSLDVSRHADIDFLNKIRPSSANERLRRAFEALKKLPSISRFQTSLLASSQKILEPDQFLNTRTAV